MESLGSVRRTLCGLPDQCHGDLRALEATLQSGNRRIFIDEELDCLHIPDVSEARTYQENNDLCLELRSNKFGHRLAIRSRLMIEGIRITTESPANERLPFLTGMGGFLQFVANGMAGLITDQPGGPASHWACLPDGIDWIRLHGIHHAGKRHGVELKRDASGKPAYSLR